MIFFSSLADIGKFLQLAAKSWEQPRTFRMNTDMHTETGKWGTCRRQDDESTQKHSTCFQSGVSAGQTGWSSTVWVNRFSFPRRESKRENWTPFSKNLRVRRTHNWHFGVVDQFSKLLNKMDGWRRENLHVFGSIWTLGCRGGGAGWAPVSTYVSLAGGRLLK